MTEKITRQEALTILYNEIQTRLVKNQMALVYWQRWSKKLAAGPQHDDAIKTIANLKAEIHKDEFYLPIVGESLKK